MDRWLFLDSGSAPGAENMAVDEHLLDRAETLGLPPVLRLYSFDPPALTIGAHQAPERVLDLAAVSADGLDVVRRVTGGRALLHDGELTYAIVAPTGGRFGRTLDDTFMIVSEALRDALRRLGLDAAVSRGNTCARTAGPAPPCLSSVTRHELAVRGRKIAGSAQRKRSRAFLQHGSILLRPGSERIVRYLRGSCAPLEDRVTSLSGETRGEAGETELRAAIVDAFTERFSAAWEPLRFSSSDEEDLGRRALAKRAESAGFLEPEAGSP